MYKRALTYLALTSLLMGETYYVDGVAREFDTETIENHKYINAKQFEEFGVEYFESNKYIGLDTDKVEVSFKKNSNVVEVNEKEFTLTNRSIDINGEYYIDFDFALYVFDYYRDGNSIVKVEERELPLTRGNFNVGEEVETIVSLSPGVTEKLYEIGAFNMLLARTDYATYPEQASNLPSIGSMYTPKIEDIIAMEPDIVIAETHFNEKILNKLEEAGIEVYGTSSAKSLADIYDFILDLGVITGRSYEAKGLNASLMNKVDRAEYVLGDIEVKPTTYYVVGTGNGEYTAGADTFIAELIRKAGAINVADDVNGWVYSLEKLIDHNPQYIFGNDYNMNTMVEGEVYKGLDAINKGNYFVVDQSIFNLSGPRLITEGLKILIGQFHGEQYVKELKY